MKEKLMPILVLLLVGASFAVGSMWTELRHLKGGQEKQGEAVLGEQGDQPTPAERPQIPEVEQLSDEDWQALTNEPIMVKGSEDAPLTIVEFSEYQCPFCGRYVDEAYQEIMETYGDKIRYIFKDYPLAFHEHAQNLAMAARCASEQEKYWDYHDLLFGKRDQWAELENIQNKMVAFAKELELDIEQFTDCYTSAKYEEAINNDLELGKKMGVSGTPTFFINGEKLVGAQPFENFQPLIERALNQ